MKVHARSLRSLELDASVQAELQAHSQIISGVLVRLCRK